MDKSPRRIREMFDQISPRYDFLNHLLSLNTDVLWRRRAVELLGPVSRVLDVCCGTGDLGLAIRRRWRAEVVGVDFAGRMLEVGRRKSGHAPIRLVQGDALRLPVRDGAIDAATVAFGIRNVADPQAGVAEMARVVRPGGRVLVLEFSLPANRLLRAGYLFYFSRVLPKIGRFLARSEIDAYRYLPDSVSRWPTPDHFSALLVRAGLRDVRYELLSFGVAAIHIGTRA